MTGLQFFNSPKYLLNLVCLGLSFIVLNIYPWITLPRRLINAMAAFFMAWFSEKMVTYPA